MLTESGSKKSLISVKSVTLSINQSVIFTVAYVAAATARTTKSVTVTQMNNSYSTTSG